MKLFGRIFLLILCSLNLFGAKATLSSSSITQGERVALILSANGDDVKFPNIEKIGGYKIISTGLSQSIEYINGKVNKKIEKHYEFMPLKSLDIPSYEIIVDGKTQKTKPLHLKVEKQDAKNSSFLLEMKIKKKKVKQFEAVPVEFIFKRDIAQDVREIKFYPPKLDNFWLKEGKKIKPYQDGNYIIHKIKYFLFPQKEGTFEIGPASISIGVATNQRDIFGFLRMQLNWKTIISNTTTLEVEPLNGTNLFGIFDITAKVDKNQIKSNEAVNLTVKITGEGNFDDIEEFNLKIDGANIYKDKPTIKTFPLENKVKGEYIQKFSISSFDNFTIPPLKLTYYDANLKKIVTKKTKPIKINVEKSNIETTLQIAPTKNKVEKQKVTQKSINYYYLVVAFLLGVFVSILSFYTYKLLSSKNLKFPKFKNDKELLKELLKYRGKDPQIDNTIKLLEENIYANGSHKIDKKILKELITQLSHIKPNSFCV